MTWTRKAAALAAASALAVFFTMPMTATPAAAWWRHGCWGCGAFAAGAIAGAAVARPYYAPPYYYYPPRPVVYPPYPVCPVGVNPWYCR